MADGIDAVLRELAAGYVARVMRDARAGVHTFVLTLNNYAAWPRVASARERFELAAGRPVTVGHSRGQAIIRVADDTAGLVTLDELMAQVPGDVSDTGIPLGIVTGGPPLWLEVGGNRSNILIVGQPHSGKTWLTHSIILALARRLTPKRLKLVLLDPKHHDLSALAGAVSPFVERLEQGYDAIDATLETYAGIVRNAKGYERETVIVLDEFLSVLDQCPGAEKAIAAIMRTGREYGYRFIACSQAGGIGALAGSLSGLWSMRIVGRMDNAKSAYDAAGISDSGAEKLTGAGDFLAVYDGKATRFRACVPPVTYSSGPVRVEPELVLERVLEIAQAAPTMPVSMAIPVDDSRDTAKDVTVYRELQAELGYPPGVTAWAKRRFTQWQVPYAGNRITWMRPRYNDVLTGLGQTPNVDAVSDDVSEEKPEN